MVKIGKQRKISNNRDIAENMINLYFDEGKNELQYSYIVEKLAGKKYLHLSNRMRKLEFYPDEEVYIKGNATQNVFENEVRTVRAEFVKKGIFKEETEYGSYELTSSNQEELLNLVDKMFNYESSSRESKLWYENLELVIRNYLDASLVPLTKEDITDDVQEFVNFSDRSRNEIELIVYNRLNKMVKENIVSKVKKSGSKNVYQLIY